MNKKFIFLLALGMGLSLFSCKDYLDVNADPNQSIITDQKLQLSSAQLQTAIGMGQRIWPTMGIWSQYYTGGPGVSLGDPDQHKLSSSEGNDIFTRLYRSNINLDYIVTNSTDPNYVAIARILKAYNFHVCADLFGNIPYTEALKGDLGTVHPKYDSAKDVVYPGIERELVDAIKTISESTALPHPGTDDLIYGGDMAKWSKFANTLLLKIYLRQGASGQAKLAALYKNNDQFLTANADNAAMSFPGGSAGSNPFWNAAKSTALGNYYVATTTVLEYLNATADPRVDAFFDKADATSHHGLYPGDVQNAPSTATFSRPAGGLKPAGGLIFSPTAPIFLITSWEGNLLLAEAAARGWISTDAKAAYETGVKANFEYLGVTGDSEYLAGGGAYNASAPIKSIALQKWTCMNGLQLVESWIETRRFDSASLPIFTSNGGLFKSPTKNALGVGVFPSILPYPENEESLNQSFPGQHPITDKVFWDN